MTSGGWRGCKVSGASTSEAAGPVAEPGTVTKTCVHNEHPHPSSTRLVPVHAATRLLHSAPFTAINHLQQAASQSGAHGE